MDIEKEIDKMYEELDQKQAEMEELGLINYGDMGYYWRNPEEYEKDKRICELKSEVERLEHKLAEKEKEIERLKQLVKVIDIYNQYSNDAKNLIILNPDNCYINGHQVVIKTNNQSKIDYAVEQLEKVKEKLVERIEIIEENEREGLYDRIQGLDMWQENKSAIKIIDQLITEIKEGK